MTNQTAATILSQMGGQRFVAMTGANNLLRTDAGLQLSFKGCRKYNKLLVELDASDTYTVRFMKQAGAAKLFEIERIHEYTGVHAEQLRGLFTAETGLHCTL